MSASRSETTFPERGVLYIAFGQRFVSEAIFSAKSLKKFSPNVHVSLFSDVESKEACFDHFRAIEVNHKRCKVDYIPQSPYERTIYLDSDTRIVFPIDDMFDVLDRFDLAACMDFSRKRTTMANAIPEYAEIPYGFSEYNSGVIAFRRNDLTDTFFAIWRHLYYENQAASLGQDQPSFRVALWKSDIRIGTLPPEFNVRSLAQQKQAYRRGREAETSYMMKPRILHWHQLQRRHFLFVSDRDRPSRY